MALFFIAFAFLMIYWHEPTVALIFALYASIVIIVDWLAEGVDE